MTFDRALSFCCHFVIIGLIEHIYGRNFILDQLLCQLNQAQLEAVTSTEGFIRVIAGAGSGKSSVARELTQRYGLKEVWSYTARPPRFDGEPGHIFVTPEQFDAAGKMSAFTLYDGYRYGVPESAIEENDIYVIDPAGIRNMWERYSGSKEVVVIAIYAPQEERAERMLERGDTPEAVKERLQFDVKEFENLHIMADAWFSNRILEDTVMAVYSYMMVKERWL